MKLKNFQDLVEKRFTKKEIAEIERQAELEARAIRSLQKSVSVAVAEYMEKNKVGFNEMTKRLNSNPAQLIKIKRGTANLTLASVAHIAALLGQEPFLTFKKK
jgi:hypothetical protein